MNLYIFVYFFRKSISGQDKIVFIER